FNPDESDLTMTGGWTAPNFYGPGGSFVATETVVWSSPAQAQADWDRSVQPGLLDCLAAGVVRGNTKTLKISVVSKATLAFPAVAPRTAAYQLRLKYAVKVRVK